MSARKSRWGASFLQEPRSGGMGEGRDMGKFSDFFYVYGGLTFYFELKFAYPKKIRASQ